MFVFHIALATSLIALAAGFGVFVWAREMDGHCKTWGNITGYLITILALLSIVCTLISAVKMYKIGYMHESMMMTKTMESPK